MVFLTGCGYDEESEHPIGMNVTTIWDDYKGNASAAPNDPVTGTHTIGPHRHTDSSGTTACTSGSDCYVSHSHTWGYQGRKFDGKTTSANTVYYKEKDFTDDHNNNLAKYHHGVLKTGWNDPAPNLTPEQLKALWIAKGLKTKDPDNPGGAHVAIDKNADGTLDSLVYVNLQPQQESPIESPRIEIVLPPGFSKHYVDMEAHELAKILNSKKVGSITFSVWVGNEWTKGSKKLARNTDPFRINNPYSKEFTLILHEGKSWLTY